MTTIDVPSTDFVGQASDTVQGFSSDVAAVPPAAPAPAADVPKVATPVAPAAPEAAKPTEAAPAPASDYELKVEGMPAEDLKTYVDLFKANKIEPKAGQAILDNLRTTFKARADSDIAAAQTQWKSENSKDATASPRFEAAMSVLSPAVRDALKGEVYVDHPVLFNAIAEIGAFVQKATKQDTAVAGTSPVAAPKFDPANTSSAAFAAGVSNGF